MDQEQSQGVAGKLERLESTRPAHGCGSLRYDVMNRIESVLPNRMMRTAETGCGRSTILFSNLSDQHTVFCLDDRDQLGEESSVRYFQDSELFDSPGVDCVFGPTQMTLPTYQHVEPYDCVLIDGPHGYPFPDLEYYFFYPHIKKGGFLIVDDVQIPSIGRMADIIQEDQMWELAELVHTTAIFRRTQADLLSPTTDGWYQQDYNRRRTSTLYDFFLKDGGDLPSFEMRLIERGLVEDHFYKFYAPPVEEPEIPPKPKKFWKRIFRRAG